MNGGPSLFDWKPKFGSNFDGETFEKPRDGKRLNAQLTKVFTVMRDGKWRTLDQIAQEADAPPASVSARLRDLRKDKFGGHAVGRRYLQEGLFEYCLIERV